MLTAANNVINVYQPILMTLINRRAAMDNVTFWISHMRFCFCEIILSAILPTNTNHRTWGRQMLESKSKIN